MATKGPDFRVADQGSILVLTPLSQAARIWIDEHIQDGATRWCGGIVIEHRYIVPILKGIAADGYTLEA